MIDSQEWTMLTCPREGCHTQHALPDKVVDRLRETHESFYCPYGHSCNFPQKTEVERLRERINQKDHLINQQAEEIREIKKVKRKPRKTATKKTAS